MEALDDAIGTKANRDLGNWLMSKRLQIERVMQERLGAAAPAASGPEAETLRRFRTFSSTALLRGEAPRPVLDGLRPNERRVMALLSCWADAAAELAGPEADAVREGLAPLLDAFRIAIRTTGSKRKSSGRPRATRRAITAAIDLVSDLYFAIDVDSGEILDANPAAGSALGVTRDALLGIEFNAFVPGESQGPWWTALDAIAEGQESRVFLAAMQDRDGRRLRLEVSATGYLRSNRTIALVLARPATKLDALIDARSRVIAPTPSGIAPGVA
ncbi:MAG: PAS domain-containing protein [Spirochaetaceae bacterium]|nr:PAS domain-containing protein [Spirochaetaceae bacterium]